jgi:hypothetical protein
VVAGATSSFRKRATAARISGGVGGSYMVRWRSGA